MDETRGKKHFELDKRESMRFIRWLFQLGSIPRGGTKRKLQDFNDDEQGPGNSRR
jgi:hypothetical protein